MINIAKYSDLSKKKGLIDLVKKEDIKDELKERFGLDDGQINDLLEEGKMWGSPYVHLPKFNLDISSLQAADLSDEHHMGVHAVEAENEEHLQHGGCQVWTIGDFILHPLFSQEHLRHHQRY